MRILKLLTFCVAVGMGATAVAADYTLTVSSWAPPTHGVNAKLWPTLIKMIEDATGGKVTAQIKYRLGPPPAQMDLVQDGAADMSWISSMAIRPAGSRPRSSSSFPATPATPRPRRSPTGACTRRTLPPPTSTRGSSSSA